MKKSRKKGKRINWKATTENIAARLLALVCICVVLMLFGLDTNSI